MDIMTTLWAEGKDSVANPADHDKIPKAQISIAKLFTETKLKFTS